MDTTVADPLIGALIDGRYRVRGRIARGGMAVVYHAIDERLERTVAVKLIQPTHAGNKQFLARFEREAKTVARLTHPNIVAVFDTGDHDGLPYLVMEYVQGQTLRDVLTGRGRLPSDEAVELIEPVLAAVAAAHRAGLVHRDVKPENVLIGDDGSVKVADFGLARAVEASNEESTLSGSGQLMATAAYVAPELVTTGHADPRSDVYSAGIMLFELLTGAVPYVGEQAVDVAYQHVERDVPAPSRYIAELPKALDELILRTTRRDPDARCVDADAFGAELRQTRDSPHQRATLATGSTTRPVPNPTVAIPHLEQGHRPASRRHRGRPEGWRRPGLVAAVVLVVLGLVAALGGWWLGAGRYTEAPGLLTMSETEAEAKATELGFQIEYDDGQFSETVPEGTVLAQDPQPQGRIAAGGTITVTLSLGPERYTIPNLAGEHSEDAAEMLRDMDLSPEFSEEYSDTVSAGRVISVDPEPETVVRPGDPVTLVVSKGPPPIVVPNVVGNHIDTARPELESSGLVVDVTKEENESVEAGMVVSQSIEPSTGVSEGTTIELVVSTGPPIVTVPDVSGQTSDEATRVLEEAGLEVKVNDYSDYPFGSDSVYTQAPEAGEEVAKGSTVEIWIY